MREIKFRVWSREESAIIPWEKLVKRVSFSGYMQTKGDDTGYALMQFTGFKDDLGNDIYEGDVLQGAFSSYLSSFDERTSKRLNRRVVKWVNNGFYLCFWNGKVSSGLQLKDRNSKRYRIIGNIYDNPELQEEEE